MSNKILVGIGAVFALAYGTLMFAPQVMAAGRFGSEDSNYIKSGDTVDGAAYLAGKTVQIEGTVNGDVNCAAETIVITGTVNGDVNCAGASVKVSGKVSGDVHVAGENVTLSGEIGGSATAFGATITVDTAAKIGRDAVFAGNDVLVNGAVGRDVVISAKTGTVNGPVVRDVEGSYATLTVGADAVIGGSLHYTSDQDAQVIGKVNGERKRDEASQYTGRKADIAQSAVMFMIAVLSWTVLIALALRSLFPKKMHTATSLMPRDIILATALGVISLMIIPIVAVALMASIIALPLGVALILAWIALCIVSPGVTAIYLGRVVFNKQKFHPVAATALSALGLGVFFMIPLVNILVIFWSLTFGTGAVLYAIRGEHEPDTKSRPKAKLVKA